MNEARAKFEQRRTEFRGLRNWCESCGAVLCCFDCLTRHKVACWKAAWSYGLTLEEFHRQLRAREALDL